jgi:hypothetical protein
VISKLGDHEYAVSRSRSAADILNAAYVAAVEKCAIQQQLKGLEDQDQIQLVMGGKIKASFLPSSPDAASPAAVIDSLSQGDHAVLDFADLELSSPLYTAESTLRKLPPVLTVLGGKELFADDILRFVSRLNRARNQNQQNQGQSQGQGVDNSQDQGNNSLHTEKEKEKKTETETEAELISRVHHKKRRGRDVGDRLLVAPEELHAFPVLWRHPFHRVLAPIGLGWLFNLLFPYRKQVSDSIREKHAKLLGGDTSGYGLWAKRADLSRLMADEVHSLSADTAIRYMAEFILRIRERR